MVTKCPSNSGQSWQRFYQLTKLLDSMHDVSRASWRLSATHWTQGNRRAEKVLEALGRTGVYYPQ